jgi:putative aldouronate transport system permease protein
MKNRFSLFNVLNTSFLAIISVFTLLPFLIVLGVSFSDEASIAHNGFKIIPKQFSLAAYKGLFANGSTIFNAYKITLFITIVGTITAVMITCLMGYALSRKNLKYRNIINIFVYVPMVFFGGIVPFFIVLVKLKFTDNIWGLIIPMIFNPFNLFLILNFFRGLPDEIMEAAKIDGAGEFRIFWSIAMKLALPGIATITLFYALAFWNEWTLSLYLISDTRLYPLQFLLRQIMSRVSFVASASAHVTGNIPAESTKMATVILTIGPIVLLYPFIQKYFVKGITIGAVKG